MLKQLSTSLILACAVARHNSAPQENDFKEKRDYLPDLKSFADDAVVQYQATLDKGLNCMEPGITLEEANKRMYKGRVRYEVARNQWDEKPGKTEEEIDNLKKEKAKIEADLKKRKSEQKKCKTFEDRQREMQDDLDAINAEIAALKLSNAGNFVEQEDKYNAEKEKRKEAFKLFAEEYTRQAELPNKDPVTKVSKDTELINKVYKNLLKKEKLLGVVPPTTGDVDQNLTLIHEAQKARLDEVNTRMKAYFTDRNANHDYYKTGGTVSGSIQPGGPPTLEILKSDYAPKVPEPSEDGKILFCVNERLSAGNSKCYCKATGTVYYGVEGWVDADGKSNNALLKELPADESGETECSSAKFGAIDGATGKKVCWCKQPNYVDQVATMQKTCEGELKKLDNENDEQYFIRCSKKIANERYIEHYLENHILDKSTDATNTDANYLDLVDIYEIGVGDQWRIEAPNTTKARVITAKGKKNSINRKCMVYFPNAFGNKQPDYLAARYALEVPGLNMISVDFRPGATGFLNAVAILRDIGLNKRRLGCHEEGVGVMGEGLGGYMASKVTLFAENVGIKAGNYYQVQVLMSPFVGTPTGLSPSSIEEHFEKNDWWKITMNSLGDQDSPNDLYKTFSNPNDATWAVVNGNNPHIGLPPTLIVTGEFDFNNQQSRQAKTIYEEANALISLVSFNGGIFGGWNIKPSEVNRHWMEDFTKVCDEYLISDPLQN